MVTDEFLLWRAYNVESVSLWRHHSLMENKKSTPDKQLTLMSIDHKQSYLCEYFGLICYLVTFNDIPFYMVLSNGTTWASERPKSPSNTLLKPTAKETRMPHIRSYSVGEAVLVSMSWASYQIRKIAGCACAGNDGNVFPATDFIGIRQIAIPACITARASRTCPDACRDR